MSKRNNKKKNVKEESDDEMSEIVEDTDDVIDEEDLEQEDEDEEYNEVEEIEETEVVSGCILDKVIEDDMEEFENNENSEVHEINNEEKLLKGKDRISSNRLTKYEMVRILGERTKQLTMGAKPLIKNYESLGYDKIAEEEFKLNMIPYKIKRPLPNGRYEIWTLDELYKNHLLALLE
jgi:DNA-directed RNA polymerase subunit K/omega